MKKIYNFILDNLSLETVDAFFSKIREIPEEKENIFIALAGGNSVLNFYENLVLMAEYLEKNFWKKLVFFLADEREVSLDNSDSNFLMINKILFQPLLNRGFLSNDQIIYFDISKKNYFGEVSSRIKSIDIAVLSSGEDGHIASIFPNHSSFNNEDEGFIKVEDSPKPPKNRISISKSMLLKTHSVFLFFIGKQKENAYKLFLDDKVSEKESPNKLCLKIKSCTIVTDFI